MYLKNFHEDELKAVDRLLKNPTILNFERKVDEALHIVYPFVDFEGMVELDEVRDAAVIAMSELNDMLTELRRKAHRALGVY